MRDGPLPVRIAVADDHPIFRDGLRRLLESEPGFAVIAEAKDGVEALQMTRAARPDILLLDVAMPRLGGIEALGQQDLSPTRVILLTAAVEPRDLFRAVQLGAQGVVFKESATRDLIDGIHRVMAGQALVGTDVGEALLRAVRDSGRGERPFRLTAREIEIVEAIAAGESNREIATRLKISLQTVKHHLTSAFDKTGTSSRLELALFAIRHGISQA